MQTTKIKTVQNKIEKFFFYYYLSIKILIKYKLIITHAIGNNNKLVNGIGQKIRIGVKRISCVGSLYFNSNSAYDKDDKSEV